MIPSPLVEALQKRIDALEAENLEIKRDLHRTENARIVLLGYYERHKARIREMEEQLK